MQTYKTKQMLAPNGVALSWWATGRALYTLAKPGIVNLALVSALAGFYIGSRGGSVGWDVVAWTLATLTMATAGACMLNNVYDRDIDRLMKRTSRRPLASGEVSHRLGFAIGMILAIAPLPVMAVMVNMTAAVLTAAAVFGYVVVYTMLAKRRTPWANQLGGIAGAMPPVIGVAAATGSVTPEALYLFAIMAVWQQPHALSLALKYREDYARAKVPVVPVARGVEATKLRIFVYAIVLLVVSVLPYAMNMAGIVYFVAAVALGSIFTVKAYRFMVSQRDHDMKLFLFTLVHLTAICVVLIMDLEQGLS